MDEGVFNQISNVAMLPGIVEYAFCMPDGHRGYGFPIGGVAATDGREGVISPGGIGFDINCGMRLILTGLTINEVKPHLRRLVDKLFASVPCGVGSRGFISVSPDDFRNVLEQGARWCIKNGYGWEEDLNRTEENGCFAGADATKVSNRAVERGFRQIGTLGSGNHYLEIQLAHAANIFDKTLAAAYGLVMEDQVVVMFHCGSRGFGHQVATDYLQRFLGVMGPRYSIAMPDRELACAPFASPDGQDYYAAMKCAVNMSFANRQVIAHRIREVFSEEFRRDAADLGLPSSTMWRTILQRSSGIGWGEGFERCWCTAKDPPVLSGRVWREFPRFLNPPDSRLSSVAAWRPARTYLPASVKEALRFFPRPTAVEGL